MKIYDFFDWVQQIEVGPQLLLVQGILVLFQNSEG